MPQDYYSDAATPPAATAPEPEHDETKEASESATAVLPKEVLGGKEWKPGEEIVLEIVQVNEDGAVVKYATEKGEKGDEYKEEEPTAESSGGSMGNPGPMY